MSEYYARRANPDGSVTRHKRKKDYQNARFQAMGVANAQRAGINRKTGGGTV